MQNLFSSAAIRITRMLSDYCTQTVADCYNSPFTKGIFLLSERNQNLTLYLSACIIHPKMLDSGQKITIEPVGSGELGLIVSVSL